MQAILDFVRGLYTTEGLTTLIQTGGLIALIAIVFSETGLLVGFFLPGDSLLVTAGIFASPHAVGGQLFDPVVLTVSLVIAAILGDQLNYVLGRKTGDVVYSRPDGRLIKRHHFEQARVFYEMRGPSAIVIARFVPILRTFVPFIGGVAKMNYRRFVAYNIVGGTVWVVSLVSLGYVVGMTPLAAKLHRVIVVVIAVSLLPLVYGAWKQWRATRTVG